MPDALTDPIVPTTTLFGHRIYVDPSDFIGRKILRDRVYEKENLDAIAPILQGLEPRTILDIGANIGNHALAWERSCARLYAFEPSSRAYALLRRNVEENGLRHLHPLHFGLSDADSRQALYLNTQGNLGASSLHRRSGDGGDGQQETVLLRKGDDYLRENGIDDVDFIKIDVEGHERQALIGLQAALHSNRPILQVEWDANSSSREWVSDPAFMDALLPNYRIYAFIKESSKAYWLGRPFGRLRRTVRRVLGPKKRIALKPFDSIAHQGDIKDLLLVPDEKLDVLAGARVAA